MRKLLLCLLLAIGFQTARAQYDYLDALVVDSSWNYISGYKVWINVYRSGGIIITKEGYTTGGVYRDSVLSSLSRDSIKFIVYDCNGEIIKGSWGTQPPPFPGFYSDTMYVDTTCMMPVPSCQAGFMATQSKTAPLTMEFTDTSTGTGVKAAKVSLHMYFFGDNDSVWGSYNPLHTYPAPGKYFVTRTYTEHDSVHGHVLCHSVWSDTVEVLAQLPAPICQASYLVDTVNSGNGVAVIYNNSTPAHNDTNYTISYLWDFGDGDTSTAAFPTHTYATPGSYPVCLTMTVDSAHLSCTTTYCDTLGIDSTGNLIYKGSLSSFVLEVRDPATISISEKLVGSFELYPNPAGDQVFVKADGTVAASLMWQLTDLKGTRVQGGKWTGAPQGESFRIDLSRLPAGVYLLQLQNGYGATHSKIIKQ